MHHHRSNQDVKLIIDDSDTSITYSGNWVADSSNGATYFHAYGSTIHYTFQPNATTSISFYGSYITVLGIIPSIFDLNNAASTAGSRVHSSYQFDDGPVEFLNVTLEASQHFTDQVFFQPNTTQSDGHHTLAITNLAGMLVLDYFTIVPNSEYQYIQKIDDAAPNITYNNSNLVFNISRADFNGTLHSLSSQSTASLKFNGNFVAVYGALPAGGSLPVVSFTLDNVESGSIPRLPAYRKQGLSQVLFWKSSTLSDGQHNLLITAKQGEFLLDFILIQTSDGAGAGPTTGSQSLTQTTTYVSPASSTNTSLYGSATPSSSASLSSPGASFDHTTNTSAIVGGAVGGAVGFVVLLLAVCMIRVRYKRRTGLRSKTQSNTEPSSKPPVQAALPVTTIATTGTPCLVHGSGPHVTDYIIRTSMESVPLQLRSNSASLSPLPQDLTPLSLPTNSQWMSWGTAARYIDDSCLPVRRSMLGTHRSSLSLPPANRSSTGHGPYQGYELTLDTRRPPLPPLPPANQLSTGHGPHQGYGCTLYTQRPSLPPLLPRANQLNTGHDRHYGHEQMQRLSLPSSLPPTYRSSTGYDAHQRYEHTQRPSSVPSLPPTYRSSTGYGPHQGYEHAPDMYRPSLPPSLPPTYRSSAGGPHQGYEHTPDAHQPSLPPSLPPTYRSSAGQGPRQGYELYEGIVKD